MKEIPLSQGQVALVDDEGFEWLSRYKWHARKSKGKYYVARKSWRESGPRTIYMHRAILAPPAGIEVDHKNLNGLDNQRANLRLATAAQQNQNKSCKRGSKSGYKGVTWSARRKRWLAHIYRGGPRKQLGSFRTKEAAAVAYNAAAIVRYGEFARLNEVVF